MLDVRDPHMIWVTRGLSNPTSLALKSVAHITCLISSWRSAPQRLLSLGITPWNWYFQYGNHPMGLVFPMCGIFAATEAASSPAAAPILSPGTQPGCILLSLSFSLWSLHVFRPAPPEWLLHISKFCYCTRCWFGHPGHSVSVLTLRKYSQKILSQWYWSLLNHIWFLSLS